MNSMSTSIQAQKIYPTDLGTNRDIGRVITIQTKKPVIHFHPGNRLNRRSRSTLGNKITATKMQSCENLKVKPTDNVGHKSPDANNMAITHARRPIFAVNR